MTNDPVNDLLDELARRHGHRARVTVVVRTGGLPGAVEQAGHALGLVAALEAAELTHGDVQGFRPLAVRDLAREPRLDQTGPRHLLLAHLESLPCVHGRTFLLTR